MVWCVEDEHGDGDGDRGDQMHRNAVSSPGPGAVDYCEYECEGEGDAFTWATEDQVKG